MGPLWAGDLPASQGGLFFLYQFPPLKPDDFPMPGTGRVLIDGRQTDPAWPGENHGFWGELVKKRLPQGGFGLALFWLAVVSWACLTGVKRGDKLFLYNLTPLTIQFSLARLWPGENV